MNRSEGELINKKSRARFNVVDVLIVSAVVIALLLTLASRLLNGKEAVTLTVSSPGITVLGKEQTLKAGERVFDAQSGRLIGVLAEAYGTDGDTLRIYPEKEIAEHRNLLAAGGQIEVESAGVLVYGAEIVGIQWGNGNEKQK